MKAAEAWTKPPFGIYHVLRISSCESISWRIIIFLLYAIRENMDKSNRTAHKTSSEPA
jgi:hypothetical protein